MPKAKRSTNLEDGFGEKSDRKSGHRSTNSTGHDCTICRKSNMTLSGLKIHLLTHSGEKPYHCTVCDKRFTCSSNLKKHLRIHNKDYIYECEVCGKTCSDPSNMKKHMTVHSDEKAYVCPSCGKSYSYAQSLRQHMDDAHVENGEKRVKTKRKGHFPCPECGKVFGYYWRCSLHQDRVHAVDKPFKCPECGKAFARETILNKHLQTHEKPFPCTICDRKFSFRDQLQKHNRIHSGERPYQCDICLRAFSQRGSLTEHKRTHTGLKPFACSICGQKFSSSSSLRRHERKVKSCFPAPPGEEIPIGSMYPRKAIYVPTPPAPIQRVQTAPVVTESPPAEYFPSTSSSESQISALNTFSVETGLKPALSSKENEIRENIDVNGNCNPAAVPNNTGQISMLVRCDKDGKISVVPVAVHVMNGTNCNLDISAANQPVTVETSNHCQDYPNPVFDLSQPKFSKPNSSVTMETTNNYSCDLNCASEDGQPTFSEQAITPVTMATSSEKLTRYPSIPTNNQPTLIPRTAKETSNYHHHGNKNQPNLAMDVVKIKSEAVLEYPRVSAACVKQAVDQVPTIAGNCDRNQSVSQNTMTNGIQFFPTKPSSNLALDSPKTIYHSPTQQHHPSTEFTKNSPFTTNGNATSNSIIPRSPHTVNASTAPVINQAITIHNNDCTTWSYTFNTPRSFQKAAIGDVNNNKVSENINNLLPVKHSITTTNNCELYPGDIPPTNSYHESAAQIPLHGTIGISQSMLMEPKTIQPSCVKMEQEDVKPIIGVDVAVFN